MRFEELLGDVEVLELRGDPGVDVSSVEHDSRSVRSGACFACIPGAVTDGHLHAPSAVRAGAVALLVERPLDLGVAEARVESVREAWAAAFDGESLDSRGRSKPALAAALAFFQ